MWSSVTTGNIVTAPALKGETLSSCALSLQTDVMLGVCWLLGYYSLLGDMWKLSRGIFLFWVNHFHLFIRHFDVNSLDLIMGCCCVSFKSLSDKERWWKICVRHLSEMRKGRKSLQYWELLAAIFTCTRSDQRSTVMEEGGQTHGATAAIVTVTPPSHTHCSRLRCNLLSLSFLIMEK